MRDHESPEGAEQRYFAVQRLQNYFLTMMLLSATIGLCFGMLIGEPTKLMLVVSGLGVTISVLIMIFTSSEYAEIEEAVGFRVKDERSFWHRVLKPSESK